MQSPIGMSANACRRCTDSARRRMLAATSILMEAFFGLVESHEPRGVVLMFAGNDDSPTAICPINNLPHTDFVMVAEQSLIADGEKGGSGSPSFDGDDAVRPEKTLRIAVPHGDGPPQRDVLDCRSLLPFTPGSGESGRSICAFAGKPHRRPQLLRHLLDPVCSPDRVLSQIGEGRLKRSSLILTLRIELSLR